VTWFIGDFHSATPWIGSIASDLSWVFLAPLLQLALAYPSGRPQSRSMWTLVAAVWLATATPWVEWNDDTILASAMGVFALAGTARATRAARKRREAIVGLGGLMLLVLWAIVVPRLELSVRPIAFDAGVALVGTWLYAGTRRGAGLAERAIELDESTGTLRSALAELLGDPELQVGFATEAGEFVDDRGRVVQPASPLRRTTELADASGVVGVVVHDPRVLRSAGEREAVTVAVSLAGTRARMRRVLRQRTDDISRSTLRLIRAGDDERLRLSARLDAGMQLHLDQAARLVAEARTAGGGDAELEESIDRAEAQLRRTRSDLAAFVSGLGVRALAGRLPSAIGELTAGLPFEVELRIADLDCASELAATIWFVCSEGVSNVLKHAAASKVVVEVTTGVDEILVLVEDDGRGGADASGSGLSGLRDRVMALGGSLRIESRAGGGTRLVAALPQAVPAT
jgi:signal transduction histidine kinase